MLRRLKDKILTTLDGIISVFCGVPTEVDTAGRKYIQRDAFDLYDTIMAEMGNHDCSEDCTVITSYENISILSSAGLILHDENTTKMWLSKMSPTGEIVKAIGIAGSVWHGNNYGNIVFRELPYESKKA
jgi:hypothetical protein